MANAGDLLASESLLLAIVGVLLGIWYPEISAAINVTIPDQLVDAGPEREQVKHALHLKALPLAIATFLIAVVFAPNSIGAVNHAIRTFTREGSSAFSSYDAVQTSLVLVTVLTIALWVYLASLVLQLHRVLKQLTG
jgi:hypothetical protein